MAVLFKELNRIIFTALYHTFSTSHGIEFTVNDRKIFYGLIPLSFTVCNRITKKNHIIIVIMIFTSFKIQIRTETQHHCYCPMLLMQTTISSICIQANASLRRSFSEMLA